nr:ribbon-helix-helix domain-containing protein [Pajaroellobacter abortibovis]
MSRKKISTTIYVTPEQMDKLRLLHERTKVPVAVYIREGIDLVLHQYQYLLPGQLPLSMPSTHPISSSIQSPSSSTPSKPPIKASIHTDEKGQNPLKR